MSRTNTTEMTMFELPPPKEATFTFVPPSSTSVDEIRIALPVQSGWHMPTHWHPSADEAGVVGCHRVTCVSGRLCVSTVKGISGGGITVGSRGMTVEFEPGRRVSWGAAPDRVPVALTATLVADHVLWRNICSAVLDNDIFPRLASTPWWLKALFALLRLTPSLRNRLLDLTLWFQMHTMFAAHDFHIYHGRIPINWLWMYQPFGGDPPEWAERFNVRSMYVISKVVMKTAYWTGRLFLGMKGEYVEYTPNRDHRGEKQ